MITVPYEYDPHNHNSIDAIFEACLTESHTAFEQSVDNKFVSLTNTQSESF
jgi:hypothetical protein